MRGFILAVILAVMNRVIHLLLAAFAAVALFGCKMDVQSIKSVEVVEYEKGTPTKSWKLTHSQVDELTNWFAERRWGWLPVTATYLPKKSLTIKHTDGTKSGVGIASQIVIFGQYQRTMSEAEAAKFEQIIGQKNDS